MWSLWQHLDCMCWLFQVKGFPCLAGGKVIWQRSGVCQHKDFTQNMLSLISVFLGSCPFAFSPSKSLLFFLCTLGILDIPKFQWSCSLCVSPAVSTQFFSWGASSPPSVPLCWLLSLTPLSAVVPWQFFIGFDAMTKGWDCAGFSSDEEMPWLLLGVPVAGDGGGWFSLGIRFTSPCASLVTVVLLQAFCWWVRTLSVTRMNFLRICIKPECTVGKRQANGRWGSLSVSSLCLEKKCCSLYFF